MLLSCGQLELEPDSSTNHHEEEPSEYTKHFCVVIITHHAQEFSPKISRGEAIRGEDELPSIRTETKNYPENEDGYQVLRFFVFCFNVLSYSFLKMCHC